VRHSNNVGRIDPFPMDPTADQQWRIRRTTARNSLLRIDPLGASSPLAARQDATFQVTS